MVGATRSCFRLGARSVYTGQLCTSLQSLQSKLPKHTNMDAGKHSYYSTNVYPSKEEQAQLLQYQHVPKQGKVSTVITVPTCTQVRKSKHSYYSANIYPRRFE